jgi:hypothetical protein
MKLVFTILMINWLVHSGIDYNNRTFVREIESVFKSGADQLQKLDITSNEAESELAGQFFMIENSGNKGYAYVGRVLSCRGGGCSHGQALADAAAEYFDYFILYDGDAKVLQVRVFNYQATHGHGITSRGWLRQFIGYNGSGKLDPGKNIDAISGATISVKAIASDIEYKTRMLKEKL